MRSPLRGSRLRTLFPVALACVALALTGCGNGGGEATTTEPPASTAALTVSGPWVKAADGGMTAVFGTLHNPGSTAVTVVSASTSASPRAELHEVTRGPDGSAVMRRKEGGFVVEPGADLALAPGGNHIMVMEMPAAIRAGDRIDVTLTLSDGRTAGFSALAKTTTSGEENYESGSGHASMSGGGHG